MMNYIQNSALSVLLTLSISALISVYHVEAHANLSTPKPRNVIAYEKGEYAELWWDPNAFNNLNSDTITRSSSVCGSLQEHPYFDMDDFTDYGSQEMYSSGDIITVDVELGVDHGGHFEFSLCPTSDASQACFSNNKLEVVTDNLFGTDVLWPEYPHRAMLPPATIKSFGLFSYQVKIPENLASGKYILKFMYVSANSCHPEGYKDYVAPESWGTKWFEDLAPCNDPYSVPPPAAEEVFHNCADIIIAGIGTLPPTKSPKVEATCSSNRCGANWSDANSRCASPCNGEWGDSACGQGEHCFGGLDRTLACCSESEESGKILISTTGPPTPSPTIIAAPDPIITEPPTPAPTTPPITTETILVPVVEEESVPAPQTATATCSSSRCGAGWSDANSKCGASCTSWTDAACALGENCFGTLDTTLSCCSNSEEEEEEEEASQPTPEPITTEPPTPASTVVSNSTPNPDSPVTICSPGRCGAGWSDANTKCGASCSLWTDPACGLNENCYWGLDTTLPCCGH